MKKIFSLFILTLFCFYNSASAGIIYVKAGVAGSANTGVSWTDAYDNLQTALDIATSNDTIWVAKGVYFPTVIAGTTTDNRDKTFLLKDSVSIYGGFAGNETSLNQRILSSANQSILSGGDIGSINVTNNVYHVLIGIDISEVTTLDGFSIRHGNADGTGVANISSEMIDRNLGGGIYLLNSNMVFNNITVDSNYSNRGGAGINNENSDIQLSNSEIQNNLILGNDINGLGGGAGIRNAASNPEINHVIIGGNSAYSVQGGGGMRNINGSSPELNYVSFFSNNLYTGTQGDGGGAMYNVGASNPIIQNCIFNYNTTDDGGGGAIYNDGSIPEISYTSFTGNKASVGGAMENDGFSDAIFNHVLFEENEADEDGGAVFNWKSNPVFTDVVFKLNTAEGDGGALYNYNNSSPVLTNVMIKSNSADGNGGGIYNRRNANPVITNTLIIDNSAGDSGGGVYIVSSNGESSSPIFTNVTIADNFATVTGGGGFDDGNGNTKIRNCIITRNSAPLLEDINAPIAMIGTAVNSVIIGDEFYLNGMTAPVMVTGDIFDSWGTAWGWDYRLAAGSYAIDRGDGSLYGSSLIPDLSAITTDINGAPRFAGNAIDLGAFEVCADTLIPSVTIIANPVTFFANDVVTFTATPVNGGDYPYYGWYKNNLPIQFGTSEEYTGVADVDFFSGDSIAAVLYSSYSCANYDSVRSNQIALAYSGVGITPAEKELNYLQVFPNPNTGNFYLKAVLVSGKEYQLEILDILGRRLYSENFSPQNNEFQKELKLQNRLQPGIYYFSIKGSGEAKKVSRIVVR